MHFVERKYKLKKQNKTESKMENPAVLEKKILCFSS